MPLLSEEGSQYKVEIKGKQDGGASVLLQQGAHSLISLFDEFCFVFLCHISIESQCYSCTSIVSANGSEHIA